MFVQNMLSELLSSVLATITPLTSCRTYVFYDRFDLISTSAGNSELGCPRIRQVNLEPHSPSLMKYIEHLILRAMLQAH